MRMRMGAALVVLALLVSGCAGRSVSSEWSAAISVQGNSATVTVAVPGKKFGKDYHPHIKLDGGPVVMMSTETYTFANVKPGSHQVGLEIADSDHQPFLGMSKTLDFQIGAN